MQNNPYMHLSVENIMGLTMSQDDIVSGKDMFLVLFISDDLSHLSAMQASSQIFMQRDSPFLRYALKKLS